MATKDRRKLQHIHSSIADKQPTPQSLEVGEIAVNNSAGKEFLSLKNSNDKVVRFSSDSTIIDWIEKKEVMPYSGVVDNVHLDTNRSNIEIKINQVAAKNTPKYNLINGAVDIDGQPVNPSTDGGKTDGAGIAIDMSRYAMIGANPTFSSITVTHRSNLSGTTNISNGAGGTALNITTTDVTANDTNWTETITNKKSTVNTEEDKITTLKESATTRTTVVGTENLTVSGTTTEAHTGNVTITNSANVSSTTNGTTTETKVGNVVENHSGTTTETKRGVVTENNLASKTENTTGAHSIYSTGNTCINSQADANFYGKVNTNIGVACDGTTKGSATTVVGTTTLNMSGATTTISGNTTNVTGATTLNLSGNTTNKRALTANTTSTSAYTSATTATTVIGTSNTSATTATLSGNTLDITEATRLSAKTPSTYVSGTSLNVVETSTDIESCGRISGKTNAFTIQECAAGSGKTVINQTDIKASGKTLSFDETTSISAKTPTTELSGTNLTVNETTSTINSTNTNLTGTNLSISETNTTINSCGKIEVTTDKYTLKQCSTSGGSAEFEFCNGYTVKSNAINLQQCGTAGTVNITSQTQNVNGGSLTIRESGATDFSGNTLTTTTASNANINVKGNLTEVVTGTTNETHTGAVTINNGAAKTETTTGAVTENNKAGYTVNTTGDTCLQSTADVNVGGAANTNIGTNCDDSVKANYVNIKAKSGITETANTVTISGTTSANISGATVNVSGGSINETSSGKTCITAGSDLNIGGDANTNIGYNCAGTGIANSTNIFASTAVTINAPTTNITGNTYLSGKTYFNNTCEAVDANELSDAFCEVISRGAVTMTRDDNPFNSGLSAVYKLYQNGSQIGYDIDVPKDGFLKNVELVESASTYYLHFVWNIFDADTKTYSTGETYVNMEDLVKDIDDRNPSDTGSAANHNVVVDVHYDETEKKMVVSAETTPTMHVGNMYVTGTTSASTVSGTTVRGGNIYTTGTVSGATVSGTSTSAGTLTVTGNTTLAATTASSISATSVTSPSISGTAVSADTFYGKMSKKLTWAAGAFTADTTGYNGSADKTITVPTAISHLATRGKLTVTHNGLSDAYDPATDKSMTLPHSALTVNFGPAISQTSSVSYDTSAARTITIPTSTAHLTKSELTVQYGSNVSNRTSAVTYDTTSDVTVDIPTTLSAISNNYVSDSSPATTGGIISIKKPTNINGTLNVTGNLYATDTISGTNVSAQTINATSIIKSPVISGTNVNGLSINGTNISGTTVKGDTISGTNITASNKVTTNELDTSGNVNLSNIVTIDTAAGQCVTINRNLCVNGVVTAQQQIYSSDRNLKENISLVTDDEMDKVANINYKSYNFKNDENKSKIYGVIAQDVQDAGLNELVYTNEDGNLAVDYTSLMILKLAHLRKVNDNLVAYMSNVDYRIAQLEKRIKELEEKNK